MKIDKATLSLLDKIQEIVAKAHRLEPLGKDKINNVCGVDVSYNKKAVATAVLWSCSERKVIKIAEYIGKPSFPYIAGYLFMREAPLVISAVEAIKEKIDLVLVDGHGIAHPRRAGLAVFVGLALEIPTLGIAKSLLAGEIGSFEGMFAPILLNDSTVGIAFRIPDTGKTYFASPGHKITIDDSIKIVKQEYTNLIKALELAHRSSKSLLREGK